MARPLRFVFYGVNGSGSGHLTRLAAIARWVRRYTTYLRAPAEIFFLTSSEADVSLFRGRFASFKLPSKTAVSEAGIDKLAYLALAKQWVWHSLALLRPDVFVVDTFPRGAFGELLSALDLCRKRAFVYRPTKASFSERPDFQAMLPLYDVIVVPDEEEPAGLRLPEAARARTRFLGPVFAVEGAELLPRAEARARLDLGEDELAVYVTAGGGGDRGAEAHLIDVARALSGEAGVRALVGAGPLYRGRRDHRAALWLAEDEPRAILPAFDVAIAAAGYNTFHELCFAGVPAVWAPQEKVADDQAARAARAAAAGAAVSLPGADPGALVRAALAYRDPGLRARASAAARALVPSNRARAAAAELLGLVLPASEVEAAEAAVGEATLEAARELGEPVEALLRLAQVLEGAAAGSPEDAAEAAEEAGAILRLSAERGIPADVAQRLAESLCRKLPPGDAGARGRAARRVLAALAPFRDWPAATAWLKLFGVERELPPEALASELEAFLGKLREARADLYRGIVALSKGQGAGLEVVSNAELLRAASEEIVRS